MPDEEQVVGAGSDDSVTGTSVTDDTGSAGEAPVTGILVTTGASGADDDPLP